MAVPPVAVLAVGDSCIGLGRAQVCLCWGGGCCGIGTSYLPEATSFATLVFRVQFFSVLFSPSGLPAPPLPRNVFLRAAVESVPHPRVPIPEGATDLWSLYHAKLPVLRSLSAMGVQRCGVQRDVFSQF